jgi:tetratricopeptide (TPR) repeat protein
MKLLSWKNITRFTLASCLASSLAGCSRDHIEAINLANAGDKAVQVNVEGAIQKYEEASRLDPTNHQIFWKLAKAYQKREDWDQMASTLARATQVAPTFANYWYYRGFALMQKAVAAGGGSDAEDAYAEAKAPLQKCIEADPRFAECYHELGAANWWTNDDQAALEHYAKAIEHDPTIGYFYPPMGELLVALKFYDEAEAVLKEGTRLVPPTESSKNNLYGMYVLLSQVYQARDDLSGMVDVLEKADQIAGDDHPEIAFNLGSTYAVMQPPQKEKAIRLLQSFNKRACRSGKAAEKYKEQCATSADLVQKLGGNG